MNVFIGIDPGVSGAISILAHDDFKNKEIRNLYSYTFKDDLDKIRYILHNNSGNITRCYIEKVHSMSNQGVKTTWVFAENYGFWKGLLFGSKISFKEISPQSWKKALGLSSNKEDSITLAKELFPNQTFKRTERCRTEDHNIAESALLAYLAEVQYLEDMEKEKCLPF